MAPLCVLVLAPLCVLVLATLCVPVLAPLCVLVLAPLSVLVLAPLHVQCSMKMKNKSTARVCVYKILVKSSKIYVYLDLKSRTTKRNTW
jgi:hypothetical protein